MSSAPYWGQLPGPRVNNRRVSGDDSLLDQPFTSNRASVQTANTDTTLSALQSPAASHFTAKGLAPRPPSYQLQRNQQQPPATAHASAAPLQPGQDHPHSAASPSPPASPDAPRAPAQTYLYPTGNGGLPYTHPAPGPEPDQSARKPRGAGEAAMDPDSYYTRADEPLGASSSHPPSGIPQDLSGQPRMPPITGTSDRRKKFADGRSPLQRLELTLDSMTKEEKRARMQAAEQRARERARLRAAAAEGQEPKDTWAPSSQPAAYDRRPAPAPAPALAPAATLIPESARSREAPMEPDPAYMQAALPSRHQPDDSRFAASGALQQPLETESAIPKRNLSFRERTARNDIPAPIEDRPVQAPQPAPQPAAPSSSGFSLTRSGSNKLRKDPPGDPWSFRHMPVDRAPQPPAPIQPQPPGTMPRVVRDREINSESYVPSRQPPPDTTRRLEDPMYDDDFTAIRRRATEPVHGGNLAQDEYQARPITRGKAVHYDLEPYTEPQAEPGQGQRRLQRPGVDDDSSDDSQHHRVSNMLFKARQQFQPGAGLYKPPQWLDEWQKATVGSLSGPLLDLREEPMPNPDVNKAWWEDGGRRGSSSYASRPRKAEAFDGEYDDTTAPTRFKPPLYMRCGPLLRYCGIRREPARAGDRRGEREIWRGSVMIVTTDSDSSYEIAPTLRLFLQNMELLPTPPHQINGDLSPEYVDPLCGHPKLGRRGETLYVRPVDHLEEEKDLSRDETDNGLFETTRSPPDVAPPNGASDYPGSFAGRRKRVNVDGEKMQKYKDVRGFRLHAERGCTFWRFNIEVELRDKQQRIAYRVNRGPAMGFWVPARGQSMNMMFYSCNGFSASVERDEFSGPDPMWRDVLNTHQYRPFHVMIGGGDQIYNDAVAKHSKLLDEWLDIRDPLRKHNAPFTPEMQDEIEEFFLENYCTWFSQGLFGLANSQIPMVNMLDDHDIFDGYGSYPHHDMNSPVMTGLGAVGFKYYMLFQHQSISTETQATEPSWILGDTPGVYINELSHSLFMNMGSKIALLALDCRTERTEHDVLNEVTWDKVLDRIYSEIARGQVEHLLVVLGVPIAYPRLVWLENILTSRLMDPIKALGRTGVFGKVLNNIDGGVEVLDDLNDHWTAKNHKEERKMVIEELQDLAIDKSIRVTILSGDVHLAAIGQFYSKSSLGLPKHKDPRYMPNIISSAIVNAPPPDMMADILNRRNKVHHFDKVTDEDMIPIFQNGVDGKPRNNKRLLPHRNWCSIRQWEPGTTPPASPSSSPERSPSPPPKRRGSLLRRFSLSGRSSEKPDMSRDSVRGDSVRGSRPPISGGGGLFRRLSRRNSTDQQRPPSLDQPSQPNKLTRTLSLGRGDGPKRSLFSFGSRKGKKRDDGGINGQWGDTDDEDNYYSQAPPQQAPPQQVPPQQAPPHQAFHQASHQDPYQAPYQATYQAPYQAPQQPSGLRGGAEYDEYSEGDEAYFTVRAPQRAQTMGSMSHQDAPPTRPFHRTPTGLSTKQMRQADKYEVDLEGGLDICLNVEVNPKDPTGITVPYRLLVPKLQYEYNPETDNLLPEKKGGLGRLLSYRREPTNNPQPGDDDYTNEEAGIEAR
ncbi:hypothetical protein B0I35DRAFT_480151 [Stachybotrys elegans]|uniref:PhoD-like phosphatase domain-containing protein n=1 Tax=Stachybotrys elegans TaxID=80388 RepID=A0A8K0SPB0_9HYPO|nr:hypothetical protein B0I35DRAFT_480151 [Stachybotrys elegans]